MGLQVIDPGFLTSVQDLGRHGYQQFGVPVSGAMDAFALRAANQLVGNTLDAAGLEFTMIGPTLKTEEDCLIALTGCDFDLTVSPPSTTGKITTWSSPSWTAVWASSGSVLTIAAAGMGGWGYLAVSGGIDVPKVMGSRSTYPRGVFGGFKGRKLEAGDVIPVFEPQENVRAFAARSLPEDARPVYVQNPQIRVILGPQADHFTGEGIKVFLTSEYLVELSSDRMGYRLRGPVIEHSLSSDILTDGVAAGSIQVPANGQPIIALSDHQTTGGYAKIATVISADIPLLVQCPLGRGKVHFQATDIEEAQNSWRALSGKLGLIEEG
jgi:antagonist of KipI